MDESLEVDGQPLRRAALLVASLDRDTADRLLDSLPEEMARAVRDALLSLSHVDPLEQSAVIRQFLAEDGYPVELTATRNTTSSAAFPVHHRSVDERELQAEQPASRSDAKPLTRASERLIAECLSDEMPQAIAVALAQLPTQRASEVVSHLPAALQAEVLERLVEFDPANSVDSPEIRHEFNHWLNEQIERSLHRAELAARLATILDAANSGTRTRILNNVSSSDARLAKELQHQLSVISASPE